MNVGGALCGTELSMSLREQTQESLTCDFKSYPIFRPASLSYNKAQWHEVTAINLMEEEEEEGEAMPELPGRVAPAPQSLGGELLQEQGA